MIKHRLTASNRLVPIALGLSLIALIMVGCRNNNPGTVKDIDGNVYHTVTIGSQVWMVENLKVTRYRNGDPIPDVTGRVQWSNIKAGAYCNYNNNDSNAAIYGHLYNWYAVNDTRGIAPQGWHVPDDKELKTLIRYLGGDSIAGGKLKKSVTAHEEGPNALTTGHSGFAAIPGGYRNGYDGLFHLLGQNFFCWSTTEIDTSVWIRMISFDGVGVYRNYTDKANGFSVRCIKD